MYKKFLFVIFVLFNGDCVIGGEKFVGLDGNDSKIVGELSNGILEIIKKRDKGNWYFCGKSLSNEGKKEKSFLIAYNVVINLRIFKVNNISPWGILATAYNESNFDACALGLHPRKWGYKQRLLKRRRDPLTNVLMRSHPSKDVLDFIGKRSVRKKYKKSGFDLGLCQILSRFYRGKEKEALKIDTGVKMCVEEMKKRSIRNNTKKPWLYWRGSTPHQKYRYKVRRWAKLMGASPKELIGI